MDVLEAITSAERTLEESEQALRLVTPESAKEEKAVTERLGRLLLFQRMIRNVRLNAATQNFGNVTLRVNQLRALSALIEFLQRECNGDDRGYFKQPTGAGKTVLFGIIAKLLDVPTLILVPRQNLLEGTKDELVEQVGFAATDIGMVGGGNYELGRRVTIATYQSHVGKMTSDAAYAEQMRSCELIVCDEAHRALGKSTADSITALDQKKSEEDEDESEDQEVLQDEEPIEGEDDDLTEEDIAMEQQLFENIEKLTSKASLKLAFTATPILANKHVADNFRHLIAEEKQGDLVKAGILTPYRIVHVTGSVHVDDIDAYMTEEQEAMILERENTFGKLLCAYADALRLYRQKKMEEENVMPLRGIAFCGNIAQCDKFCEVAAVNGLKARVVTAREAKGKKGNDVIKDAERQLMSGEIDLIVTVAKLGEGWNFKPANAAIWARACTSPMVVIQGIGRTSRSYTDSEGNEKPYSLVFETQWKLGGFEIGKGVGKRPLGIEDALLLNGENPEEICSMENGSPLCLEKKFEVDEAGIADVEGTLYVDPITYIRALYPRLSVLNTRYLWTFQRNAPRPAYVHVTGPDGERRPAFVTKKNRVVACQLKSSVDAFLQQFVIVPDNGIIQIENDMQEAEEYVSIPTYMVGKVTNLKRWENIIRREATSMQLKKRTVLDLRVYGRYSRLDHVDVFRRSKVDAILTKPSFITEAEAERIVVTEGELRDGVTCDDNGRRRIAVYVNQILVPDGKKAELRRRMVKNNVQPAPKKFVTTKGRQLTLHWKDDIDAILEEIQRDDDAVKQKVLQDAAVARAVEWEQMRQRASEKKKSTRRNIVPQVDAGVFYIDYSIETRGKMLEGQGLAVVLMDYVSPSLKKKLTPQAVEHFERTLRSVPGYIVESCDGSPSSLYWKEEVDGLIERLRQAARDRKKT